MSGRPPYSRMNTPKGDDVFSKMEGGFAVLYILLILATIIALVGGGITKVVANKQKAKVTCPGSETKCMAKHADGTMKIEERGSKLDTEKSIKTQRTADNMLKTGGGMAVLCVAIGAFLMFSHGS